MEFGGIVYFRTEVYNNNDTENGMRKHVKTNVLHRKGHNIKMVAYFYYQERGILVYYNQSNRTTDGYVSAGTTLTIQNYEDADIFISYEELHLGCGHFDVKFYDKDDSEQDLIQSDWMYFTCDR